MPLLRPVDCLTPHCCSRGCCVSCGPCSALRSARRARLSAWAKRYLASYRKPAIRK
jgi:hypothetical protein